VLACFVLEAGAMRDLSAGDRLDQYQLTELLAHSGMASIFKAVDTESGAAVVLKIPHLQFECDVVFFDRFRREEEIGQRLDHPGIVKVLTPREKSRMYIAMEYVEGRSVRAMMQASHPVPADLALSIARQVCDALAYLHSKGAVHRDIKPENVLVTADGRAKIIDLGIAHHEAKRRLTWTSSAGMGTPDYMAPEQIRGRRGDARTDVYALGTMLYEMLTCNLPYAAEDARALMRAKEGEEPRLPSYHVPGFDPSLEAIIMKAIEREPRDRYASAAELLVDLQNPSAVPPWNPETVRARPTRAPTGSRRLALAFVVAAILAGLASLVWLSARVSPPHGRPAAEDRQVP
jgi:eukaryotic-like serine/threonine-protein kinase